MKISLSQKYYSASSIERSVDAFYEFGIFVVKKQEKNFIVEIKSIQKDLKENFCEEFCNYLLNEMSRELR
jgi:hypothetical protein